MRDMRVIDDPSMEEIAALDEAINRFNVDRSGVDDARTLSILRKAADGALEAGLHGHSWGGYCEIKLLWVAKDLRGRGIGSALIAAAEREAIDRGCDRMILSTHSFQAPAFYERHGFRTIATIEDCPRGHAHLMMVKHVEA